MKMEEISSLLEAPSVDPRKTKRDVRILPPPYVMPVAVLMSKLNVRNAHQTHPLTPQVPLVLLLVNVSKDSMVSMEEFAPHLHPSPL